MTRRQLQAIANRFHYNNGGQRSSEQRQGCVCIIRLGTVNVGGLAYGKRRRVFGCFVKRVMHGVGGLYRCIGME